MTNDTNEKPEPEKLVDNDPLSVADMKRALKLPTKKRIRRIAEPHLRPVIKNGHEYYHFCHGTAPEIYLGSAEYILEAVKAFKIASGKNRVS